MFGVRDGVVSTAMKLYVGSTRMMNLLRYAIFTNKVVFTYYEIVVPIISHHVINLPAFECSNGPLESVVCNICS